MSSYHRHTANTAHHSNSQSLHSLVSYRRYICVHIQFLSYLSFSTIYSNCNIIFYTLYTRYNWWLFFIAKLRICLSLWTTLSKYTCVHLYVTCIDGHNRWWIDGSIPILSINTIDRYYWSRWPSIVSIHRLKVFSLLSIVSIINHEFLIRTMMMTIDPSVKNRFPCPFSEWRNARKFSSIIGRGKYDGLKGLCQKICCSKTVKK